MQEGLETDRGSKEADGAVKKTASIIIEENVLFGTGENVSLMADVDSMHSMPYDVTEY